jgi:hypothetical protein
MVMVESKFEYQAGYKLGLHCNTDVLLVSKLPASLSRTVTGMSDVGVFKEYNHISWDSVGAKINVLVSVLL